MRSATGGKRTLDVEITNLSKHGFWVLINDRELFAPFKAFPWFKQASVDQILNVEMPGTGHLYWPELDIDLAVASLENPKAFPLVSRIVSKTTSRKTKPKPAPPGNRLSAKRG